MIKERPNSKIRKWLSTPIARTYIAFPITIIIFFIANIYLKDGFLFLSHAELLLVIWAVLIFIYTSLIIEWFLHYSKKIRLKAQKWFRLKATPKILEFIFFVGLFIATLMATTNVTGFSAVYGIALACGFYHYILRVDEDVEMKTVKEIKKEQEIESGDYSSTSILSKSPKNLKEFWKIFSNQINVLENELKSLKKHRLTKPIVISLISLFIASASVAVNFGIGTGWITSEEKPYVVGYEIINRINNTTQEGYRIWLYNNGKIAANDITIKIDFPFQNTTIVNIFKHSEEIIVEDSEFGGIDSYHYVVKYSKLLVGEHANLTLIVNVDNFEKDDDQKIWPITNVWIGDDCPIELKQRKDVKFIY